MAHRPDAMRLCSSGSAGSPALGGREEGGGDASGTHSSETAERAYFCSPEGIRVSN